MYFSQSILSRKILLIHLLYWSEHYTFICRAASMQIVEILQKYFENFKFYARALFVRTEISLQVHLIFSSQTAKSAETAETAVFQFSSISFKYT